MALDTPPWAKRVALNNPAHPGHSTHVISSEGKHARRIWGAQPAIPQHVRDRLVNRCLGSNNELCGFLITDWHVVYVPNVHLEPRHNYYMEPEQTAETLTEIYESGSEVIGQFHTHPNGVPWPSPRDLHGWPNPQLEWRYWIVTNNDVTEWELVKGSLP